MQRPIACLKHEIMCTSVLFKASKLLVPVLNQVCILLIFLKNIIEDVFSQLIIESVDSTPIKTCEEHEDNYTELYVRISMLIIFCFLKK